jgi:hypothetical protein
MKSLKRVTKFRTVWKLGLPIFNLLLILLCIEFRLDVEFPKSHKYVTFSTNLLAVLCCDFLLLSVAETNTYTRVSQNLLLP